MTLQERASLQISLKDLKEKYEFHKNEFMNTDEYKKSGFIDKMFLLDEFNESDKIYVLKAEISSIENQLSDFLEKANNQDDENCLNCGS